MWRGGGGGGGSEEEGGGRGSCLRCVVEVTGAFWGVPLSHVSLINNCHTS